MRISEPVPRALLWFVSVWPGWLVVGTQRLRRRLYTPGVVGGRVRRVGRHPDPEREAELERQVAERRAGMREEREASRAERLKRDIWFATALSGLSAGRTKRFLEWIRGRPKVADEGGGGGGGG
jgi:hypothetical protein